MHHHFMSEKQNELEIGESEHYLNGIFRACYFGEYKVLHLAHKLFIVKFFSLGKDRSTFGLLRYYYSSWPLPYIPKLYCV